MLFQHLLAVKASAGVGSVQHVLFPAGFLSACCTRAPVARTVFYVENGEYAA